MRHSLFIASNVRLGVAAVSLSQRCQQLFLSTTAITCKNDIKTHETTINGSKLCWLQAGNGPHNVFMLPGALGSAKTDFLPQLENLDGSAFTLYCWDPTGYGSSRPPDRLWPEKFFSRDAADANALLKHIGLQKTSLVGWSDGGITALVMAVFYPELLDKLVLFGCNAYITKHDMELLEAIRDLDKWSPKMRQPFEDMYGREYFKKHWNMWMDAYGSYLTNGDGNIVRDRIHTIKNPTLIIHGQKDALVPREHPDFIHSQIKGSKLVNWPNAKHNLHLRYAEDFNKLVTDFLLADGSSE